MSNGSSTADSLSDHQRHLLKLALVPGLGPKLTAALLEHFGTPNAIFHATIAQLRQVPLIGEKLAQSFVTAFQTVDIQKEAALLIQHGVRIAALGDSDYPRRLTTIPAAPPLLYLRGTLAEADQNAIGIVGSRACTVYGKRVAERIAAGLARAGWTVISGLARGIDGAAHRGALEAGGRTIAVLAGGLSKIYPPEHTELANQIVEQGCLISETPMTVAPQPGMFPARNRIISGMARAVLVVEANLKSGALITVEHAAEQGREVFAVPGPVDSPASSGCLELIRNGAKMVRDADDLIADIQGIVPPDPPAVRTTIAPVTEAVPVGLDPLQQQIWDELAESPLHADELIRRTQSTISTLTPALMQLELKKWIRRLPGNQYERRR